MKTERAPESPTLKLPLLTIPASDYSNPNHPSNYDLFPAQPTASIPFKWEQAPGKPIPMKITKLPSPQTLELPPRLQLLESQKSKLPSPNSVLDNGPYEGHFGKVTVAEIVRCERAERRRKGLFGSWGGSGNKEVVGGSFVFPSDSGGEEGGSVKRAKRVRRNPSFSNLRDIKSHFWVNVFEGLKQVMPWRSKRLKKQGLKV